MKTIKANGLIEAAFPGYWIRCSNACQILFATLLGILISLSIVGCVGFGGTDYTCYYNIQNVKDRPECIASLSQIAKEFGFTMVENDKNGILYVRSSVDLSPTGYEADIGSSGIRMFLTYRKVEGDAIIISQSYKKRNTPFCSHIQAKIEAMLDKIVGKNGYIKQETTVSNATLG